MVRVSIRSGGKTKHVQISHDFVIACEEGDVQIQVDDDALLLPAREVGGEFGELLDDPMTSHVMDHAPGDHVHASLRGAVLSLGDEVHAQGTLEHSLVNEGSYRENATKRVASIRARVVAIGAGGAELIQAHLDAEQKRAASKKAPAEKERRNDKEKETKRERDERKEKLDPRLSLRPILILSVLLLVVTAVALLRAAPEGVAFDGKANTWIVVHLTLALAVFSWRRRRWMPDFHTVGKSAAGTGQRWSILGPTFILAMLTFPLLVVGPTMGNYVYLGAIATTLHLAILVLWKDQKNANIAFSLLRAKRLSGDLPDKRFGSVEGVFAGKLTFKRTHESRTESRQESRTDSDGHSYNTTVTKTTTHWKDSSSAASEASLSGDFETIDLQLRNALWADSHYEFSYSNKISAGYKFLIKSARSKRAKARYRRIARRMNPILSNLAKDGDSMLVAARVKRDDAPGFRTAGAGSFLVFTAPAGQSARAQLRRLLQLHYLGLPLLVAPWLVELWIVFG